MAEELDRSGLAVVFLGYAASLPFIASIALNPHPHVNVSLQVSSLIMLVWGIPLYLLGAVLAYRYWPDQVR